MAYAALIKIDIRSLDRFRLFAWELHELASEMRVGADPFAERLTKAIGERFEADVAGDEPEEAI